MRRARLYGAFGQPEKALADLDKVIELDPKKAARWLIRGDFYSQRGEWPKAIADYERAHQVEELGVEGHQWHGMVINDLSGSQRMESRSGH